MQLQSVRVEECRCGCDGECDRISTRLAEPHGRVVLGKESFGEITGYVRRDDCEPVGPPAVKVRPKCEQGEEKELPILSAIFEKEERKCRPDNREHVRPREPVSGSKCETQKRR